MNTETATTEKQTSPAQIAVVMVLIIAVGVATGIYVASKID